MAFVLWNDNNSPNNPYNVPTTDPACRSSLELAHPSVADALVLSLFNTDVPYNKRFDNWLKGAGRAVEGGLRTVGSTPNHRIWIGTFIVSLDQLDLFEAFLQVQKDSTIPVTLNDLWIPGRSGAYTVFLDVDQQYTSAVPSIGFFQTLQFVANEI